jgi:anaerobic ribonucleoside-triphosphate reductase activating protein
LQELYDALDKEYIQGLTLTGGNPMDNMPEVLHICRTVKERFPDKDIWLYSGYTLEQILQWEVGVCILEYVDVLVDGAYIEEQRDISLKWVGSKNQRVINLKETLKQGKIITLQND